MTTETTTRIPFDFHLFNRPVRVVATVRAARKIKALFSVESARSSIDLYAETENNGIHDFCALNINMLGRVGSKSGLNLALDHQLEFDVERWDWNPIDKTYYRHEGAERSLDAFRKLPLREGDSVKRFSAKYLSGKFVANEKVDFVESDEIGEPDDNLYLFMDAISVPGLSENDYLGFSNDEAHTELCTAIRSKYLECPWDLKIRQPRALARRDQSPVRLSLAERKRRHMNGQ